MKALEAVKGKIEDKDAFLKALRGVKFEAPRGPIRFDEDQNVVFNTFIERVEKRGGKINNQVVYIEPDVGQSGCPSKPKIGRARKTKPFGRDARAKHR